MLTRISTITLPASTRFRLGTALLWVGVLTWAPFLTLRAMGYRPSLLWFLPFHLLGVIGGSRLRAAARRDVGANPSQSNRLRTAGHSLILCGVAVWALFFYLKLVAQVPVEVGRFLPYHLTGVLSGVSLLVIGAVANRRGS